MGKQLESFKTSLEDFAGKYKQEIRKNPEFRGHFQQMCARIGVDPLACMLVLILFYFFVQIFLCKD